MKKTAILLSLLSISANSYSANELATGAKILKCEAMASLITVINMPFIDKAIIGMHLYNGLNASQNVLKSLESYEQKIEKNNNYSDAQKKVLGEKIINAIRTKFLSSVSSVLPVLYDRKSIMKQLAIESLGEKETLFHKFFDSTYEESKTFFNNKLRTKEDLRTCCNNFLTVFADLEKTIPDVFELGRKALAALAEKK